MGSRRDRGGIEAGWAFAPCGFPPPPPREAAARTGRAGRRQSHRATPALATSRAAASHEGPPSPCPPPPPPPAPPTQRPPEGCETPPRRPPQSPPRPVSVSAAKSQSPPRVLRPFSGVIEVISKGTVSAHPAQSPARKWAKLAWSRPGCRAGRAVCWPAGVVRPGGRGARCAGKRSSVASRHRCWVESTV